MEAYWSAVGLADQEELRIGSVLVIICLMILFIFFFCLVYNLNRLLKVIRRRNRKMPPSRVWLLLFGCLTHITGLIAFVFPGSGFLFGILKYGTGLFLPVCLFYVVPKITGSISKEYQSRNLCITTRPAYSAGIACAMAGLLYFLLSMQTNNSGYIFIGWIVTVGCWLVYAIQTELYRKIIENLPQEPDTDSLVFNNLY